MTLLNQIPTPSASPHPLYGRITHFFGNLNIQSGRASTVEQTNEEGQGKFLSSHSFSHSSLPTSSSVPSHAKIGEAYSESALWHHDAVMAHTSPSAKILPHNRKKLKTLCGGCQSGIITCHQRCECSSLWDSNPSYTEGHPHDIHPLLSLLSILVYHSTFVPMICSHLCVFNFWTDLFQPAQLSTSPFAIRKSCIDQSIVNHFC